MVAAVIVLAAALASICGAAIAAVWKLGDEKAARVYSDHARLAADRNLEVAKMHVEDSVARINLLEELLDEAGVDVPPGRGLIELRAGIRRAGAVGADATGDPSPVPRVSLGAPAAATAAPGGLVRGGVPVGRG